MSIAPVSGSAPAPGRKRDPLKANLVLAAVLITVSSFAYWYEFKRKKQVSEETEQSKKLIAKIDEKEIESITVVNKDKGLDTTVRCVSECKLSASNARFQMEKPVSVRADESNVGNFIATVGNATVEDTIPIEGDKETFLKKFGLGTELRDSHKAILKLKGEAAVHTVYFGINTPVGGNAYLYYEGPASKVDAIRIVPSHVKDALSKNLAYWRYKRLFGFASTDVKTVTLDNKFGKTQLVKDGQEWKLLRGATKTLGDYEAIDTFLTGVVFLNAIDFPSDDKKAGKTKLGMKSQPSSTLQLELNDGKIHKLEVYEVVANDKSSKLYGILEGQGFIAELDRTTSDKFLKKADSFRFHNLLTPVDKQNIAKFEVSFVSPPKAKLAVEGVSPNWTLKDGALPAFDSGKADLALSRVGSARIAEFLPAIPSGNPERSSWAFFGKDGKTLRSFKIYGDQTKGTFYVKFSGGEAGLLERGSGAAIPSTAQEFEKAAAPPAPPIPAASPKK